MENVTARTDFRSRYVAFRQALESRQRPLSTVAIMASVIGLGVALISASELNRWLALRFSLSAFEKAVLDSLAPFLIFFVYSAWRWRIWQLIRSKQN